MQSRQGESEDLGEGGRKGALLQEVEGAPKEAPGKSEASQKDEK